MSLLTKYRPEKAKDFVGNQVILDSFLEALHSEDPPKSYLICGPSGTGKTTLARMAFSKLAAELIEVDAASYSGAKDMRALVQPFEHNNISGRPRVVIIDECHSLSNQAWQVLLKPTEEAHNVFFFFCTTEEAKVPKTIKTRSMYLRLDPIPERDLFDALDRIAIAEYEESRVPKEDVVQACADGAEGSMRQALANLEACVNAQCHDYQSAADMCATVPAATQVLDLCRAIAQHAKIQETLRLVSKLPDNVSAEGARLQILMYITAILLKNPNKASEYHEGILSAFEMPFRQEEKKAPLVLACMRIY